MSGDKGLFVPTSVGTNRSDPAPKEMYLMNDEKRRIREYIDENKSIFLDLSRYIWENPELSLKEYKSSGGYCGQKMQGQYELAQKLDNPIITPSAKNAEGHDENISIDRLREEIGSATADELCQISLSLYEKCYQYALDKGIIIADTKFEFG